MEVETKLCRACNEIKVARAFHRVNGVLAPRCKQCKIAGNLIPRTTVDYTARTGMKLRLGKPTKNDYVETYELLQKMGYDLKKDIHTQFCERYNLKPRNPKKEFKSHISPEECGFDVALD